MCLILTLVFVVLAIQSYWQGNGTGTLLYGSIAAIFAALMGINIQRVRNQRSKRSDRDLK